MVALDRGRFAAEPGLDHVGVNRALRQKVHSTDLFSLILKDANELLADNLALALGGVLTGQLLVEAVTSIYADKVDVELAALAKDLADLLALILAQQTVVHEHAGQLLADGLGQHGRADAGIHAARQGAEHLAVADLFAQGLDGVFHEGIHLPVTGAAADIIDEVMQNFRAILGVQDLGVELHSVEAACLILHGSHRTVRRVGHDLKAGGGLLDVVVMAHPADILRGQRVKQRAGGVQVDQRLAVLALGCLANLAAQHVHHQLAAVADAEDGHAPVINFWVDRGRIRQVGAVGAAGEDDALGVFGLDFGKVGAVRINLAIYVAFADAAGDQLIILAAEIQNDDSFLLHEETPFSIYSPIGLL